MAATFQPIGLSVDGGEGTWHAEQDFVLRWSNPPGVVAVHYRLLDPSGEAALEARIGWAATALEPLTVPNAVGAYTAEVWLEDGAGGEGPPVAAKLRFDDAAPGPVAPLAPPGWIGRNDFPLTLRVAQPAEPLPLSGIRGYAVSIDREPDGEPCAGPSSCTEAETDLRGGIDANALEVADLPEGLGFAHAVAVSGSGVRSAPTESVALRVDETYPVTALAGVPDGWSRLPVTLTATATDDGSGMSGDGSGPAPFTAIRVDGGAPALAGGDRVSTTAIGSGVHTVAFYARDAAGNVDDGSVVNGRANPQPRSATVRIDRDPPKLAFAGAQNAEEPERIDVRVGDSLSGIDPDAGEISVRSAGSGEPFEPLATDVAGSTMSARWNSEAYPPGEYEFRATAFDRAGNRAATTARVNGSAMRLPNPLKALTRLTASLSTRDTASCRRSAVLRGRLTAGRGSSLTGMPIRVVERFARGSARRERATTVRTGADGRFRLRLRSGPSRTIRVLSPPTAKLQSAATPAASLTARPCVSLRVSSPSARVGGRPIVFSGRVRAPGAARAAGGGAPVQLQFRLPGMRWSEFRTVQANGRGRFRYAYRFADDDSRGVRFQFRAFVAARAGWPFAPAGSPPVKVLGR
ncbi:MAG: hypothetical protein ACM3N0_13495 [Chloroflexota bacterium]